MKEQKVVITNNEREINELIDRGWSVKSVTAQPLGIVQAQSYSTSVEKVYGKFCFVMERDK